MLLTLTYNQGACYVCYANAVYRVAMRICAGFLFSPAVSRSFPISRFCHGWTGIRRSHRALAGFFSDVLLDHDPHTSGEAHELHPELMLVFQFFKFSFDL